MKVQSTHQSNPSRRPAWIQRRRNKLGHLIGDLCARSSYFSRRQRQTEAFLHASQSLHLIRPFMTGFLAGPPGFQRAQRREEGDRDELHAERVKGLHPKLGWTPELCTITIFRVEKCVGRSKEEYSLVAAWHTRKGAKVKNPGKVKAGLNSTRGTVWTHTWWRVHEGAFMHRRG